MGPGQGCEVDLRVLEAQPEPAVFARATSLPRDVVLVLDIVVVGPIVRDDEQYRYPVVGSGPERGRRKKGAAVAEECDARPAAGLYAEGRTQRQRHGRRAGGPGCRDCGGPAHGAIAGNLSA